MGKVKYPNDSTVNRSASLRPTSSDDKRHIQVGKRRPGNSPDTSAGQLVTRVGLVYLRIFWGPSETDSLAVFSDQVRWLRDADVERVHLSEPAR